MILAIILLFPSFLGLFAHRIKLDKLDISVLVLIILLSFYAFYGFGIKSGLGSIEKNFLYLFLPYFAGRYFIRNKKDLLKFFHVLGFISIVVSLIVLLEFYLGRGLFDFSGLMINQEDRWISSSLFHERHGLYRAAATFVHPIWLGIFLLMSALINVLILVYGKIVRTSFAKMILITQIGLAAVATMISQSRTAIVSFALVVFFVFLINIKKRKLASTFAILLLASLIIIPVIYFFFNDYLNNFILFNLSSEGYSQRNLIARIKIVIGSIEHIFKYVNLFGEASFNHFELRQFVMTQDLTNGFLRMLLLNGLFCTLLYMYIWLKGIKESYKFSKYSIYGSILFFIMIYLFIADNATVLRFQVQIIFFIILGITFNPYLRKRRSSKTRFFQEM